jgi:hypothetical protein
VRRAQLRAHQWTTEDYPHSSYGKRCRRKAERLPAFATGYNPSLNQSINELLAKNGALSEADLNQIYASYIAADRVSERLDNVGGRVLDEIAQFWT